MITIYMTTKHFLRNKIKTYNKKSYRNVSQVGIYVYNVDVVFAVIPAMFLKINLNFPPALHTRICLQVTMASQCSGYSSYILWIQFIYILLIQFIYTLDTVHILYSGYSSYPILLIQFIYTLDTVHILYS